MNLTDPRFVKDIQAALRCGMIAALKQDLALANLGAEAVERTLYAILREKAVEYLSALGYSYLTSETNFFVIGEVGVPGTNKRADGLICDPVTNCPVYAIEIGYAGADKFYKDFDKTLLEWTRTGLTGVFILLFDTDGIDKSIYRLDSAIIRTPRKENFIICPLVLPTNPSLDTALLSITCYNYWERETGQTLFILTFSNRDRGEVLKWTTDVIQPVAEAHQLACRNEIRNPEVQSEVDIINLFSEYGPQVIICEGEQSPLKHFSEKAKERFAQYLKEKKPIIVFIGDWLERENWENDPATESLLPVKILGENHKDGKWDCRDILPRFGKEIHPGKKPLLDLASMNNTDCSIKGFVKVKRKQGKNIYVDLEIETSEGTFPMVVTDSTQRVVWLGTGIGGWGANWYKKYAGGYQIFWKELLTKLGVLPE